MKLPKSSQWRQLFKVLKGVERTIFLVLVVLAVLSGIFLVTNIYVEATKPAPAYAGTYTEGVVGQPRFINPIYGETNDIDRSLIDLVYSGLMTFDKGGNIVPDLAKSFQISSDGRTYTFQLKENLFWQDGMPLTADDVIYTIKTIQNSDYKSPLRANWLDVNAQKLSPTSVSLTLNSPYNSFLETCTLKIIPQHLWKNVLPENFALSSYNLQPIGSGPFILSNLEQTNTGFIKSLEFSANHKYFGKIPYISKIYFQFFGNKNDLVSAANAKSIDGFSISSLDDNQAAAEKEIKQGWTTNDKFATYSFSMPRYFAVFFNTNPSADGSKILADPNITKALNYAINKKDLANKINQDFKEKVSLANSPALPEYFGFSQPETVYDYNTDTADKLLDKTGYKKDSTGQRSKPNDKKLAFQFRSYLKVGSKGSEVTELQGCLAKLDPNFKDLLGSETNGTYGKGTESAVSAFQQKYLPDTKITGETGPGTRQKLNELCLVPQNNTIPLQFTLTTINQPQMIETANILRDYWQKVGVTANIKTVDLSGLKDAIKNRNYDALLYGEALGALPDLYPFWHSTQVKDPGLNLAKYQNKKADQLLKEAREALDAGVKNQKMEILQDTILADAPAVFLYNPSYNYWVSEKIKGIDTTKIVDPAKRFANITNWYINTKRTWK